MREMKYVIILEPAPNNWCAFSPDVLGCVSTGATPQETLSNFLEALEFHLEDMEESGEPLPPEHTDSPEDIEPYADKGVFFPWGPRPPEPVAEPTAAESAAV